MGIFHSWPVYMIWTAFGFVAAVLAYLWFLYLQTEREKREALEVARQKRAALEVAEKEREAQDAAAEKERALSVYKPAMPPVPVLSPDTVAASASGSNEIERTPLDDMPTFAKYDWQDYGRIIRCENGYVIFASCGKLYKILLDTCDSDIQIDPDVVVLIKFGKDGRWTCHRARHRGTRDRGR